MKLLIIDNYDSFTYNLQHICEPYVNSIDVIRDDELDIDSVNFYDKIIISPGPGLPSEHPICFDVIKKYHKKKPILGICLGAQAIAIAFGSELFNLKKVLHGKRTKIKILDLKDQVYSGVPENIRVGRYHSWAINLFSNNKFKITAVDEENIIMSFRHVRYPVVGIQYHPESILTPFGQKILENWLCT